MANIITPPPKTEQEQVEQQRQESGEHNVQTTFSSENSYQYDANYHDMVDFLGVAQDDKFDYDVASKIAFIRDFLQESDETKAKLKLKDIIRTLGVQFKGKELVKYLYQYARLSSQHQKLEEELNVYQPSQPTPKGKTQEKSGESSIKKVVLYM